LSDAERALDRAICSAAGLPKKERVKFNKDIWPVLGFLRKEVLPQIYDKYPDLRPDNVGHEIPTVSSRLRWNKVELPSSASEKDIDDIIFAELTAHWQKVAMVVAKAFDRCEESGLPSSSRRAL